VFWTEALRHVIKTRERIKEEHTRQKWTENSTLQDFN
jgi:hypothetical protein